MKTKKIITRRLIPVNDPILGQTFISQEKEEIIIVPKTRKNFYPKNISKESSFLPKVGYKRTQKK